MKDLRVVDAIILSRGVLTCPETPANSTAGRGIRVGRSVGTKKDGTNVFCPCREASDANYSRLGGELTASQPE